MANCPNCGIYLQTVRETQGLSYHCRQCGGCTMTAAQVRRHTGDRFATTLLRQMRHATDDSARACPFCSMPMKTFILPQPPIALDSCKSCTTVWFEPGKFEQLPAGILETPEDALGRALEAEASWKMEQQSARDRGLSREAPDEWWKWIFAIIGLPVKFESREISRPWATWSLAAVIIVVSFIAFIDIEDVAQTFGFIPAECWRYGGITFLTSFFLHAGFWHLFGNMYFFLLFAGEVEEHLGHWRFLALVFLAALMGDIFQLIATPGFTEPCIGASGGISGVLVFYALKFPHGKLVFFWWRLGWIQLPAWSAFVLWLLLQMISYSLQRNGVSHDNVGYMAHFGGVTTGILLWLLWRKLDLNPNKEVPNEG